MAFEGGLAGFPETFGKRKMKEGRSGRGGRRQGNELGNPRTCLANDAGEAGVSGLVRRSAPRCGGFNSGGQRNGVKAFD